MPSFRLSRQKNKKYDVWISSLNLNRYALGQIAFLVKGVRARCLIFTKCMQLFVVESPVGKKNKCVVESPVGKKTNEEI